MEVSEKIIYITLSLFCIFVSKLLFEKASGAKIRHLNMINYPFWVLLGISVIPSIIIFLEFQIFGFDVSGEDFTWGNKTTHFYVLLINLWTIVSIPIGALITTMFFGRISNKFGGIELPFFNVPLLSVEEKHRTRVVLCVFLLISFLLIFINIQNKQIPLLAAMRGNTDEALKSYLDVRHGYAFGLGPMNNFINTDTMLFFLIYSTVLLFRYKNNIDKLIFFWLLQFTLTIGASAISGSTGNLAFSLISLLVVKVLCTRKWFSLKIAMVFPSLVISFFWFFKSRSIESFTEVSNYFFQRILFFQIRGLYFAFDIFPDQHSFIYFNSTAKWAHDLFNSKTVEDYGFILMNKFDPIGVLAGYGGHFTSVFMTEMWANFGLLGIMIGPIWVGCIITIVHRLIMKRKISSFYLALYCYLTVFGFSYESKFMCYFYPVNILMKVSGIFITYFFAIFACSFFNKGRLTLKYI